MKETEIVVAPIDTGAVEGEIKGARIVLADSKLVAIVNQEGYEGTARAIRDIKNKYNALDAMRKTITKPLDEAKKKVMELFNQPLDMLSQAEKILKQAMIAYAGEQEQKAKAEQKRLQELADKEAERQKKALEARIATAEAKGNVDKVEELRLQQEQIVAMPVAVLSSIETPKGASYREQWSAEVVDISLVPREYMVVNQQALDKIAMATKGTIQIPGVKFVSKTIMSSR